MIAPELIPARMSRAGSELLLIFVPFARILDQIENNARCFLRVFRVGRRKSKNAHHAFSVGGLQVSTFFHQTRSGLANEFCRGLSERGRLAAFGECEFVADVAYDDAYIVRPWLSIERNSPVVKTAKLLVGNAIGKQCAD